MVKGCDDGKRSRPTEERLLNGSFRVGLKAPVPIVALANRETAFDRLEKLL